MIQPTFPLRSAFLALQLPDDARREFSALVDALSFLGDSVIFQNTTTPHLTLVFWKELLEIEYQPVMEKTQSIAARTAPFTLQVTGADTFSARGRDSVLFLSLAFSPELATLKKLCPWPQEHPFHPHITLARIKHPERFSTRKKGVMKVLKEAVFPFPVTDSTLFGEIGGQKQTPIKNFRFSR